MKDEFLDRRPFWAVRVRNILLTYVESHSRSIAALQAKVSHPWLDQYFLYSSFLGSHTFFLLFLPPTYLLIDPKFGRILILTSALAVYLTAVLKDYFCVKRPICPPVRRLIVGTYHLEYGFPSTHSANSISMCVIFYYYAMQARRAITLLRNIGYMSSPDLWHMLFVDTYALESLLVIYAFTIIFGRLYLGMHTYIDCIVGCLIGAVVATGSIALDVVIIDLLQVSSPLVPISIFVLGCIALAIHPIPILPCPCYEDVVCFIGSYVGVALGNWRTNNYYFEDMGYLDMKLKVLTQMLPPSWMFYLGTFWSHVVVESTLGKLVASLLFAIVPLILWKVISTPILKCAIPWLYLNMKRLVMPSRNQEFVTVGTTKAKDADALPLKQDLRRRKKVSEENLTTSVSEVHSSQEEKTYFDERFCQGVGYVGATFSYYLISYFDVKVFKPMD